MRKLWCSLLSTFNNQPTRLRAFFHWVSLDWNKIRRGARQRNKGDVITCQLLIHVVLHRAQESTRYQVTRSYSFWSVKTVGVMSEPILKPGEVNQGNHGSVFNIQFANGAKISYFSIIKVLSESESVLTFSYLCYFPDFPIGNLRDVRSCLHYGDSFPQVSLLDYFRAWKFTKWGKITYLIKENIPGRRVILYHLHTSDINCMFSPPSCAVTCRNGDIRRKSARASLNIGQMTEALKQLWAAIPFTFSAQLVEHWKSKSNRVRMKFSRKWNQYLFLLNWWRIWKENWRRVRFKSSPSSTRKYK